MQFTTPRLVSIVATALTIALGATASPQLAQAKSLAASAPTTSPFASTAKFIASKFVGGQYVVGLSAGKPDWGFTVEAMLQLKGAGYSNSSQSKAIAYNLTSANNLGTNTNRVGFLYAPDQTLLLGRAGEQLFACKVFALTTNSLCKATYATLRSLIGSDGTLKGDGGNTFSYSWVTFGLAAWGDSAKSVTVANKLATLPRSDGGFGTDPTADTASSAPDATGIALMALAATKTYGTAAQKAARATVVKSAVAWLAKNAVNDHFESWGDVDVNGTAYAVMGLHASGSASSKYSKYLATRIAADGGITTPWSTGGDTFASVQGYLALRSQSYLDLLKG